MTQSVFEPFQAESYPLEFQGRIHVPILVGGVPFDSRIIEGWIKSKVTDNDEKVRQLIAETMLQRQVTMAEATRIVNETKNLNGFKRLRCPSCPPEGNVCDEGKHELYYEGRQLKAAMKEAVSVAVGAGKINLRGWGTTKKFVTNYFPEHVFIKERELPLGKFQADGILQQLVHAPHGDALQYQEYVKDVEFDFTVVTDHPFTKKDWAMLWTTGQLQGLGSSRSQAYGVYTVVRWDLVRDSRKGKDLVSLED